MITEIKYERLMYQFFIIFQTHFNEPRTQTTFTRRIKKNTIILVITNGTIPIHFSSYKKPVY